MSRAPLFLPCAAGVEALLADEVAHAGTADLDHAIDPLAFGDVHDGFVPIRCGLVIDAMIGAELFGAGKLIVAR